MYEESDEQIYGSWGFDDEKCLDDCNFPPRIGRQGVNGCKAVVQKQNKKVTFEHRQLFFSLVEHVNISPSTQTANR
jgi:hypothetical protein